MTGPLPALPVALPLLGAGLLAALRKWLSRAAADSLGIAVAAATLISSLLLLSRVLQHTQIYWFGNWYPRGSAVLGITLVVDPVAAGLSTLAGLLVFLALIFSWRFVDAGGNHYHPLMLVFLAAMDGFVLTGDLFNMFVFFELMSTAAFALCGLKTQEPAPLQGSFNFAVTNTVAAFLELTGIALLYAVTGALNMAQIGLALAGRHDPLVLFAFTLLTCGFFIKAAIVPFHFWLPDAHAVAPTPVCVLFSGLMVELGLFAVARLRFVIFAQTFATHENALQSILLVLAVLTILVGGLMCYAEHHLKRMLAFSTICHAGIMLAGIAVGGRLAFVAMLVYLLGHAFIKGGLFLTSGILLHRLRAIGERALFARGKGLRWTALLWFSGALGLAGAPPFLLMIGEAGLSKAAEDVTKTWVSWAFMAGGALTSAAVLRVGMHTFWGWGSEPITDEAAEIGELPETAEEDQRIFWYQFVPAAICFAVPVALAAMSRWRHVLREASTVFSQQSGMAQLIYKGDVGSSQFAGWSEAFIGSAIRGSSAFLIAILLALSSVFRPRLKRAFRMGAFLESGFRPLRTLQSGHPGDYVLWISIGLASVGLATLLLARS